MNLIILLFVYRNYEGTKLLPRPGMDFTLCEISVRQGFGEILICRLQADGCL